MDEELLAAAMLFPHLRASALDREPACRPDDAVAALERVDRESARLAWRLATVLLDERPEPRLEDTITLPAGGLDGVIAILQALRGQAKPCTDTAREGWAYVGFIEMTTAHTVASRVFGGLSSKDYRAYLQVLGNTGFFLWEDEQQNAGFVKMDGAPS